MPVDLEGNKVRLKDMPGAGTRLIINGNLFRIIYVKPNKGTFKFTAEFEGVYEGEGFQDPLNN